MALSLPDYVDMITVLDTAFETDIINIYINTPGGDIAATISIIHAMMRSRATIITHADGEVASAGTLLFFAGQRYVVNPYSHFMFHDGSYGTQQKVNEHLKHAIATSNLISRLAYDLYYPAFSPDEIDLILEGRDYYADAEEIVDRINAAVEQIEAEAQAEEESETKKEEEDAYGPEMLLEEDEL